VFGDVYAIDVLTTTVWEAGGPDKAVSAAQPTGALITFPNSEVLRSNLINYTRDFPFVWDEVTVGVANESDLTYACRVFRETAARVVGPAMAAPAESYRTLLRVKELDYDVAVEPQVYVSPRDAWTDLIVRYLVPARERRIWSTRLTLALLEDSAAPEHGTRIIAAYPRQRIELLTDHFPAERLDLTNRSVAKSE
jgi:small-conductance mechanosensitive channel